MNTRESVGFPVRVRTGMGCPLMPASAVVHEFATPAITAYAARDPASRCAP